MFKEKLNLVLSHLTEKEKLLCVRFMIAMLKLRGIQEAPYLGVVYLAYKEFVNHFFQKSAIPRIHELAFISFSDLNEKEAKEIEDILLELLPDEAKAIRKYIEEKFKTPIANLYDCFDFSEGLQIQERLIEVRNAEYFDEFKFARSENVTAEGVLDVLEEYFIFEKNHPLTDIDRAKDGTMTVYRGEEVLAIVVSSGGRWIMVSIQNQ